jgi:hypothetical protein
MSQEKQTFKDAISWNGSEKTAISVRDGVLEYYGYEIGKDPASKLFKVYRSPATIANINNRMSGLPVTSGHVDTDSDVKDKSGSITESNIVDFVDEGSDARLAIKNRIDLSDSAIDLLAGGTRELSLGYTGNLVKHSIYDYEQININPHHLAIVEAGRCGPRVAFIDQKKGIKDMKKNVFLDEDGKPSLQQIGEIIAALPDALKVIPADDLQNIIPKLQEVITMAGGSTKPEETKKEDSKEEKEPAKPEDPAPAPAPEPAVELKDSAEFKDAISKVIAEHSAAIDKATQFLDSNYVFSGKTTQQIMRDALKTEHGEQKFSDSELPIAFKLLKKSASDLKTFGDNISSGKFSALKDKDL